MDTDTLSSKRVYEGAMIYFIVGSAPKPKPKPKLGVIAGMIQKFDKEIKSVRDAGYEFHHRKAEEFKS